MRNVTTSLLMVLIVALLVAGARSQSTALLRGTIPFDFVVGNQTVSSGEYTVKTITPNPEIEAWYGPGGHAFILRTIPMGAPGEGSKLVFHRYGDQYFLAEVWSRGESHQVFTNSREQTIAANNKFVPVAVLMSSRR